MSSGMVDMQSGNSNTDHINFLDPELNKQLLEDFTGERTGFVQVGPDRWFLPSKYVEDEYHLRHFEVRPDDVWVVTFPRSGTTWTQELVWLIANDLDFQRASDELLSDRFPFLEFTSFMHDEVKQEFKKANSYSEERIQMVERLARPVWETLREMPSPRFIKTHLPFSLLPTDLLTSGCKVIYVARNPKDVAVSFYHLNKLMKTLGYVGDFKKYWEYFEKNLQPWTPYWKHVKEGWENRNRENFLFLFYEEMSLDLNDTIQKVGTFLGKKITEDQSKRLSNYLNIENFKRNPSVNYDMLKDLGIVRPNEQSFVRKGKPGGWTEEFSPELSERADRWIQDNLKDTDISFPNI